MYKNWPNSKKQDTVEKMRFLLVCLVGFQCCFATPLYHYMLSPLVNQRGKLLNQLRYALMNPLNAGSQGQVWQAVERETDRQVRIKITDCTRTDLKNAYKMARNERCVLKAINNPYFLRHFDSFQENGFYYHVTEYVDSITLKKYFQDIRLMSSIQQERRFKKIAYLLLEAMNALHHFGIVHQDVKPDNVIMHNNGESLKLIDFGIAYLYDRKYEKKFDTEPEKNCPESGNIFNSNDRLQFGITDYYNVPSRHELTETDTTFSNIRRIGGTSQFVPPEIKRGVEKNPKPDVLIKPSNDFYGFGMTLYYGFYGGFPRYPIEDEDPAYLKSKQLFECPLLENLIQQLIRFNPEHRLKEYESIKLHDYFYECYVESSC